MFTWKRKRRQACGCAKRLANSRKGIGWCYQCSSLTHLQNRIEDSVELIEGMSLRLAKTALSTRDATVRRRGRKGKKGSQRKGGRPKKRPATEKRRQQEMGEQALDSVMRLLHVDRYASASSRVALRSLVEEHVVEDRENNTKHLHVQHRELPVQELDLEKSLNLQSLTWTGQDGRVERTFVSRSARDSFERGRVGGDGAAVATTGKKKEKVVDVLRESGRSNRW